MKHFVIKTHKHILASLVLVTLALMLNIELFAQNILKGPYLPEPGDRNMTIRYEFDSKSEYILEYGKNKKSTKEVKLIFRESKHNGYLYDATLSNLKPNTAYFYRLVKPATTTWFSFKTYLPNQKRFSFVAMGDS